MSSDPLTTPTRTLHRCTPHRMVAGVAAGLAEYLDVDPLLVRVAFVVLTATGGLAVPLYAALWLLVPADEAPTSIAEDLLGRYAHF
ncbi:MAG TPA: PspC domain-containing protein [Acidimicrobiales bacterium]|nr:PspC domain-containing protein [Acidimicrobiales bacterium]